MATNHVHAADARSAESTRSDASQRQLLDRAATVGLLMRNSVNAGAALLALADASLDRSAAATALMATVAGWSAARVLTRSQRSVFLAADYLLVLLVCVSIPILVAGPDFHYSNTAPQAIAGTAVISISVAVRAPISLAMTLGIGAAYALGAAAVTGWGHVTSVTALYYLAVQWLTAAAIRFMLVRVAAAVDQARSDRHEAELNEQVNRAVHAFDRDQLALLHDTAASTLLMAGQDTSLSRSRLAKQAKRDLELLEKGAWVAPPPSLEIVGSLRVCASHISIPVEFSGPAQLWLPGENAEPVIAAARESMTNADRHSRASRLRVHVSATGLRIDDDGVGFDTRTPRSGHGIDDSIIGRMRRAGGEARIESAPGLGTTTMLSWAPPRPVSPSLPDPDRLIDRIRARYSMALIAFSLVNLAISVPRAAMARDHGVFEVLMGVAAALCALAAIPGVLRDNWRFARPAAAVLMVVTVGQPLLLPPHLLSGYAFWSQGAIGWCLVPLVLALPTRTGAGVLIGYWLVGSATALVRYPSADMLTNIGLGTASILGVQLFALIFNGLMRDAGADIHSEGQAQQRLLTRELVVQALHSEYQRRYATIVANVVPLLEELSSDAPVDENLRRRARAESRRLRTLFDQADVFDHPLMQRIRPLIDRAEDQAVDISVDLAGAIPDLTTAEIISLTSTLSSVLAHSTTYARVVLTAGPERVEISIVGDTQTEGLSSLISEDVEVIQVGTEFWCLISYRPRCR